MSDQDDKLYRAETGPVRFGQDWAGVFLRGDDALGYAYMLLNLLNPDIDGTPNDLEEPRSIPEGYWRTQLEKLCEVLFQAREPTEAVHLKPIDEAVVDPQEEHERRIRLYEAREAGDFLKYTTTIRYEDWVRLYRERARKLEARRLTKEEAADE